MSKLSQLQNDLKLAEQYKQNVIANKSSYKTTRTYTVLGPETFEKIVVSYEEMKHIWTPDERHPPDFPRPYLGDDDGRLSAFIAQKVGNSAIRVPKQSVYNNTCYGCDVITYYLNDYGQCINHQVGERWNGTVKLYYYIQKQETRSEQVFSQSAYDSYLSSAQGRIDQIRLQINAENNRLALIKKQEQEQIAKQKQEALLKQQEQIAKRKQEALLKQQKEEQIAKQKQEALLKQQKEKNDIIDNIKSIDAKERAVLLSKVFNKTDENSEFTANEIKKTWHNDSDGGFDSGYLCYLAIVEGNESLFDLGIYYTGTDLISGIYTVNDKTLLQHILNSNNQSFLQKALSKCNSATDISAASIFYLEQNDMQTLNKLIEFQPNLFQKKYSGFTILQQIINKEVVNIPLIEQIITLDNNSVSILSDNGKSAFKIACEQGKSEVIELLSQHINISQEVNQLAVDMHPSLKNAIAERKDIATLIKLLKGENVSAEEYLDIKEVVQVQHGDTDIYGTFDFGELNEEIQVAGSTHENVI